MKITAKEKCDQLFVHSDSSGHFLKENIFERAPHEQKMQLKFAIFILSFIICHLFLDFHLVRYVTVELIQMEIVVFISFGFSHFPLKY